MLRKKQRDQHKSTNSPMSRAKRDIAEARSDKKRADRVRRQLAFHYALTDEIRESSLKSKFKSKQKASIYAVVGGKIIKKYKMMSKAAVEMKLNRNYLAKLTSKMVQETKRKRRATERQLHKHQIEEFFGRCDNSTTMPNKKDVKTCDGITVSKKVLNDYMDNLYDKFTLENPMIKISRATFFRCRPKHILPVSFTAKRSCLCIKHQNVALMTNKALQQNIGKSDGALDKFYETHSDEDLLDIVNKIDTQVIEYSQWKRVDIGNGKKKVNLVNVSKSKDEFRTELLKTAEVFREHVKMVKNQYSEIRKLKENLPNGNVVAQLDFAENYTCTSYDEVQSAFWNKSMVTIHPIVVYYRDASGKLVHKSLAIVSEELSHTAAAVLTFLKHLMPILKDLIPGMTTIHYISDSPTSQYRNKYMFNVIAEHKDRFGISASWHYFEAGHGKGPCDGVGAVAKRMADNAVKREKHVIQDAKGFFDWASKSNSAIQYEWVGADEIAESDNEIKQAALSTVKGTMTMHAVFGSDDSTIITRKMSCFCDNCFQDGSLLSENRCVGWETHQIKDVRNPVIVEPEEQTVIDEANEEYNVDEWIAVSYQGTWYIGKIAELDTDDDDFKVEFLTKSRLRGTFTFKYPTRPDIMWVYRENILCKVDEPAPNGKNGRTFSLTNDTIDKIEKIFKE